MVVYFFDVTRNVFAVNKFYLKNCIDSTCDTNNIDNLNIRKTFLMKLTHIKSTQPKFVVSVIIPKMLDRDMPPYDDFYSFYILSIFKFSLSLSLCLSYSVLKLQIHLNVSKFHCKASTYLYLYHVNALVYLICIKLSL